MMNGQLQVIYERPQDPLIRAAVRWLGSIKDEVAAGQTEDELAADLLDYLEGADTC